MVGEQRGYSVQVVIPKDVAPSVGDILGVLGTEVTWCESQAGMKGAIDLAREMAEERGHYYLGQFGDQVNVECHYRTTGREIAEALPTVDVFVSGLGTCGTAMGVGRRLREVNPDVRVIGVEPRMGERLQGLRSLQDGFVPALLDLDQLDGRFLVDSASAIKAAYQVARLEGVLAGVSSGATLQVALRLAEAYGTGGHRGHVLRRGLEVPAGEALGRRLSGLRGAG